MDTVAALRAEHDLPATRRPFSIHLRYSLPAFPLIFSFRNCNLFITMLKEYKATMWALSLALLFPVSAYAEQDFYGIHMKNEVWARNLVLKQGEADPQELWQGPVLNHAVRGEASLKEITEKHLDFKVTVFNDSDVPVQADPNLRDFIVYTRDGRKFPLIDEDEDSPTLIDP